MKRKKIQISKLPYGHLGLMVDHHRRNNEYVVKSKCWHCKEWHILLLGSNIGSGWSEVSGAGEADLFCIDLGPLPARYEE